MEPNRSEKSGRYFKVLKWASEDGLSFEQCGLEWLFVTRRSASRTRPVWTPSMTQDRHAA